MGYGEALKDTVENEAKEEVKVKQQDGEQYNRVPKMKLVYEEIRIREFRVTRNLNGANTRMIMSSLTQYMQMQTEVIFSLKSENDRGARESVKYSKTFM